MTSDSMKTSHSLEPVPAVEKNSESKKNIDFFGFFHQTLDTWRNTYKTFGPIDDTFASEEQLIQKRTVRSKYKVVWESAHLERFVSIMISLRAFTIVFTIIVLIYFLPLYGILVSNGHNSNGYSGD